MQVRAGDRLGKAAQHRRKRGFAARGGECGGLSVETHDPGEDMGQHRALQRAVVPWPRHGGVDQEVGFRVCLAFDQAQQTGVLAG